jgi:hypothetical protein
MELAALRARAPSTHAEAIALANEALSIRREFLGADDPRTHESHALADNLQKARLMLEALFRKNCPAADRRCQSASWAKHC